MGLIGELNEDDEDGATDLRVNSHESNGLLCIYLFYPMGIAEKLVDLAGTSGFKDRLTKVSKALTRFKSHFDSVDGEKLVPA